MRPSSPPLATYGAPLRGMDSRTVRDPASPNLLYNVHCSEDGLWRERPGLRQFEDGGGSKLPNGSVILGMHVMRVRDQSSLFVMSNHFGNMQLSRYDLVGGLKWIFTLVDEPSTTADPYIFVQAGRFLYFCNGKGHLNEFVWTGEKEQPSPETLRKDFLVAGSDDVVMSYFIGNFKPSSLSYHAQQIFACGFKGRVDCPISNPLESSNNVAAKELVGAAQLTMATDPGLLMVASPGEFRSYPLEDIGGSYWLWDKEIVGTIGLGATIVVFTKSGVYRISNHGSESGQISRISDDAVMSAKGFCRFGDTAFFIAKEGCFVTDGQKVTKVSSEMDPLWFSRSSPELTRATESNIQHTAWPFNVNLEGLKWSFCFNDTMRQQIMAFLPASGEAHATMAWVWNYADIAGGQGAGKWSIWSGQEDPYDAGTRLLDGATWQATYTNESDCAGAGGTWKEWHPAAPTPGSADSQCFPPDPSATTPGNNDRQTAVWHWTAFATWEHEGRQRIFGGTSDGQIMELGGTDLDLTKGFHVVVGLGKTGRVDSDGRTVFTDVAVRRRQHYKNAADDSSAPTMTVNVQSEGEAQKHFKASSTDMEFSVTLDNMQDGVSKTTTSTLNTLTLGDGASGTDSPLMSPEFHEFYARINAPDEEGRAITVDLHAAPSTKKPGVEISEVRVHGIVKGGSQRQA
jgi:hypothetical protein